MIVRRAFSSASAATVSRVRANATLRQRLTKHKTTAATSNIKTELALAQSIVASLRRMVKKTPKNLNPNAPTAFANRFPPDGRGPTRGHACRPGRDLGL